MYELVPFGPAPDSDRPNLAICLTCINRLVPGTIEWPTLLTILAITISAELSTCKSPLTGLLPLNTPWVKSLEMIVSQGLLKSWLWLLLSTPNEKRLKNAELVHMRLVANPPLLQKTRPSPFRLATIG